VAEMEEPTIRNWMLLYLIRLGHKNLNFIFAGGYEGCYGLAGTPDFGTRYVEDASALKAEWEQKTNYIVNQGGDSCMGSIGNMGGGGSVGWECFTCFDPHDKESTEGTWQFFEATTKAEKEHGWGHGMERLQAVARGSDGRATPKEERERIFFASPQPAAFNYQWKVKQAIDPNNLGDEYYQYLDKFSGK
jgi:hypothetical protein